MRNLVALVLVATLPPNALGAQDARVGAAVGAEAELGDLAGDFTLVAREEDETFTGALTVTERNGAPRAQLAFPGLPMLVLDEVSMNGRVATMSGELAGARTVFTLTFDTDTTFSGTWSMGEQHGTLTGRRGVSPLARAPECADGTTELPSDPPAPLPSSHPDSARIVTSDVTLFWQVLDRSTPETLVDLLHCEYLRGATGAVRDFIPYRIVSANRLAKTVTERRQRYEQARASSLAVDTMEGAIRPVFHRLEALYPDAVFPDVYFVIGALNTGGTTTDRGLLIGAEMYRGHDGIPHIVAHELVHYQQVPVPDTVATLLAQSIKEGSADFVAELISGDHINRRAHAYAETRERELWEEFRRVMHGSDVSGWLYGSPSEGRPADLGYFIGYRIAQAYYERAPDRRVALADILKVTDYREFLRKSGYAPPE